jgi:hypothetical protein
MAVNVPLNAPDARLVPWAGAVGRWSHGRTRTFIIFPPVRRVWLPLLALAACRPSPRPARRAGGSTAHPDSAALSSLWRAPHDSIHDRLLRVPRIVTAPSVVVFWLRSGDTLTRDSAQAASRDLDFYTEQVAQTLARNGIMLVPTNADTVYVELSDHQRRAIVLSGLDYPYGYLLIDPGTPERILTGIYNDEDLLDELDAYFDLSEEPDSMHVTPRVIT